MPEPGCYVDSHWGQYAIARVVQIATELGRNVPADDELAARHLAAMGPSTEPGLSDDEFERLIDAANAAEAWLNGYVRVDGNAWGWNDGDFGLYAQEDY